MAGVPLPPLQVSGQAGPSQAGDYGGAGDIGSLSVGDYYARGSRRREGAGWEEFGTAGVVALVGLGLWLWLG